MGKCSKCGVNLTANNVALTENGLYCMNCREPLLDMNDTLINYNSYKELEKENKQLKEDLTEIQQRVDLCEAEYRKMKIEYNKIVEKYNLLQKMYNG